MTGPSSAPVFSEVMADDELGGSFGLADFCWLLLMIFPSQDLFELAIDWSRAVRDWCARFVKDSRWMKS
jgi:hypothetical protein